MSSNVSTRAPQPPGTGRRDNAETRSSPRPDESPYSLAHKQVSLSSIPQSQLSQLHDPSGHRDVVASSGERGGPAANNCLAVLSTLKDPQMGYSMIVPQSEQKYR
ncbi:hypothetical protein Tco_0791683 [Tanacetum coccineum]